jgi:hypothetical protein
MSEALSLVAMYPGIFRDLTLLSAAIVIPLWLVGKQVLRWLRSPLIAMTAPKRRWTLCLPLARLGTFEASMNYSRRYWRLLK